MAILDEPAANNIRFLAVREDCGCNYAFMMREQVRQASPVPSDISRPSHSKTYWRNVTSTELYSHPATQLSSFAKEGPLPFDEARLLENVFELTVEGARVASIVLVNHGPGYHLPVHLKPFQDRQGEQ